MNPPPASTFIQPHSPSETSKILSDVDPKPQSHDLLQEENLLDQNTEMPWGRTSAGLDRVVVREVSVDVCQRLTDVWILLAGPEVVSGASQGFSDVEEMGSIRVRERSCLILLQRAKLLNIPDVPPKSKISAGTTASPRTLLIAIPALWPARAEKSCLDL